jgi:hypothetical protein
MTLIENMKKADTKEIIEIVEYRNKYCANLYGPEWVTEQPIYSTCLEALRFMEKNKPLELNKTDKQLIKTTFEKYYNTTLDEIADHSESAKKLFEKLGFI